MCVVSMIYDHYTPKFPEFKPTVTPPTSWPWPTNESPKLDLAELAKLIKEFKEALEAAKKIDILTKQPDCEDPEKAKLLKRVEQLEAQLIKIKKSKAKKKK